MIVLGFCALIIVAELASVISLAFRVANDNKSSSSAVNQPAYGNNNYNPTPNIIINGGSGSEIFKEVIPTHKPPSGENICAGKKPEAANDLCVIVAIENVLPQAGANVTKGYQGDLVVDHVPVTTPYWMNGMCPVNVHWHLGAEHYSAGEYDENGFGPSSVNNEGDNRRRLAAGEDVREGFQCNYYKENDAKFTTPFNWQHCVDMEVGQTYEVHWPHSAAGACGTVNQYQTPFYDGVFCRDGVLTDTASQIGVQAQVFTIVNDEAYYYPDLMRGMIVDAERDFGTDVAMYTGSTTGTTRNNEMCSQYSPITWQVDRKCHLISASTFDKMCADMKAQRDDMSEDLYAHGSRELVDDAFAANNHQNRRQRNLRA